jgi:5-(carboxyamino)imidazole ribonucleotide synthase
VGILAIEFFVKNGVLIANEMAPRVHNSGHWTIEGAKTSQFENHIRAVCGLPLGSTEAIGFSCMHNIISTLPTPEKLNKMANLPGVYVHLYGKEPKPNRKLGHITFHAASIDQLKSLMQQASI